MTPNNTEVAIIGASHVGLIVINNNILFWPSIALHLSVSEVNSANTTTTNTSYEDA